jgi:guanylate kinase
MALMSLFVSKQQNCKLTKLRHERLLVGNSFICFLSGASGAGKTTIVEKLKTSNRFPDSVFLHFDSIGVPSVEEMIEQAGSGKKWQELTTYRWIEKIVSECEDERIVVIEGQTDLDFIEAACRKFKITKYLIILIDCNWKAMEERLLHARQQPELVNQDMKNWADFLRKQAQCKKLPIINTSHLSLEQAVESISEIIT